MSSTLLDPATNPDADGLVGGCTLWPCDALPSSKYMFAEGQAISRSLYSLLFSRYGELHGVGDGSTTFNLPNLVDKVPRGGDGDPATGSTGGTAAATMPTHGHTISPNPHSHTYLRNDSAGAIAASGTVVTAFSQSNPQTETTSLTVGDATGSGDNWPPYVVMRWIIKVL